MTLLGDKCSPPCRDLPSAKWSGAPQGYANSHHNSCSMRRNKCKGGCWSWHPESRNMAQSMPRPAHRWPPKSCRKAPPTSLPCLFGHIWLHEILPTHFALIRRRSQTSRSQRRRLCLIGTKPYVSGSCFFHWQTAYWKDSKPWWTRTTGAANPWRLWTQRLDLKRCQIRRPLRLKHSFPKPETESVWPRGATAWPSLGASVPTKPSTVASDQPPCKHTSTDI